MNVLLTYFAHLLTVEKNLIPRELVGRFRISRNSLLIVGLMFMASPAPILWSVGIGTTPLRILPRIMPVPTIWFGRLSGNRTWCRSMA